MVVTRTQIKFWGEIEQLSPSWRTSGKQPNRIWLYPSSIMAGDPRCWYVGGVDSGTGNEEGSEQRQTLLDCEWLYNASWSTFVCPSVHLLYLTDVGSVLDFIYILFSANNYSTSIRSGRVWLYGTSQRECYAQQTLDDRETSRRMSHFNSDPYLVTLSLRGIQQMVGVSISMESASRNSHIDSAFLPNKNQSITKLMKHRC